MTAATVHTFCRYCLASCGVEVTVENNRVRKISADKQNPHSWQDFCAKGRTANQVVEHPRRILNPMRRVGDSYVEATWDEAISDIAARMNALIDAGGPDAVGAYYGNPAGYSLSNIIFMSAWLDAVGTHSRYAVGSVDQNALHVVAAAMYGSQLMVPVSDVDNCDFFLLVGTNPAVSAWNWLETVPGGWRRAPERQKHGATIVVVDPLRTETADQADLHLAVRPGQDWACCWRWSRSSSTRASSTGRTAPNSPPACRNCAGSLPTPISTTSPRDAISPAGRSNRSPGSSPAPVARW